MRNYEVFNTEQELLDRIQQLQETGYQYSEFEVYTSNELSEDSEYYYDVNKHDGEASFVDKIAAFFTGEDPEERVFSKYEWDEASKEQAKRAIDNGLYVLVVDREGYYENEENFRYLDNPENRENDYINNPEYNRDDYVDNPEYTGDDYVNNPEYNRDDYVGNSEYFENDDLPPRDDMENLYDDETFQNKEYNGNLDSNLGRPYDENLDRHFDEVRLTEEEKARLNDPDLSMTNPEMNNDDVILENEIEDDVIADREIGNESPTEKNRRELTDEDELSVENYTLYNEDDEELDYDEEDDDLL